MIKDIHTHRLDGNPNECILSCFMRDGEPSRQAAFFSPGIHPWHLTDNADFARQLNWVTVQLTDPRAVGVGELGLDKACGVPWSLQTACFAEAARVLAACGKPFVLHCVKAAAEVMAVRKALRADNAWIIHGFRGKRELAMSLVNQGFYLSFGERYNPDALKAVPDDRLLLETDESRTPIDVLYGRVAVCRGVTAEVLQAQVSQNVGRLFFDR